MDKIHRTCQTELLLMGFSILVTSSICRAETVELVTYYPAGAAAGGDQHVQSLTVGNAYQATPTPPLADGAAFLVGPVGIGTNAPTPGYALDVVGFNGANQSIYSRALDGSMARLGLENTIRHWSISNYGTQFAPTGVFAIADEAPGAGVRLLITQPAGFVGIATAAPQAPLQVGASSLFVQNDQGGNIELGGTGAIANPVAGGMPYIDFHFGRVVEGVTVPQDFNTRLINRADGILDVQTSTGGAAAQTPLSIGANIGVGTIAPQTTSPQNNVSTGNLDANDVFLRSAGQWASQIGGGSRPDASGTYTGNGALDRFIPTNYTNTANGFRPGYVLIWQQDIVAPTPPAISISTKNRLTSR